MSQYEGLPFKPTPTLTKTVHGVKIKHIFSFNQSSILFWNPPCSPISSVFKEWIVCDYEILTEEGKCSLDSRFQQLPYINMSYGNIIWCYYRQYIALWGMVRLLINVFDHVSHYCRHIWSSTWVMRLSFYTEIKKRPHPLWTWNVRQIAFGPRSPLWLLKPVLRLLRVQWCGACTYSLVADGAESLQVVQRALSSSAVDRPDVVDLPEIPFDRGAYHLVQLETHTEWDNERPGITKYPWTFFSHGSNLQKKTQNVLPSLIINLCWS